MEGSSLQGYRWCKNTWTRLNFSQLVVARLRAEEISHHLQSFIIDRLRHVLKAG